MGILVVAVDVAVIFGVIQWTNRPDRRYRAVVQVLVPARDQNGVLPPGVPPALTAGQERMALSSSNVARALDRAKVPARQRGRVQFGATVNDTGDVVELSATAPDRKLAAQAADALQSTFVDARQQVVASTAQSSQLGARVAIELFSRRLRTVESQLKATGIKLPKIVPVGGDSATPPPDLNLPSGTPLDTVLLAAERNTLVNRIRDAQQKYADLSTQALVSSSFAQVVERTSPVDVTPDRTPPIIPVLVMIGAGLLLAVAVPVLMDRFDGSITDAAGATAALSAPVLTTIPSPRHDHRALAKVAPQLELAFRSLAATSVATDKLPRAIVVTSPVGEAQGPVAAGFAAALARLGLRVALVATTPRHSWFATPTDAGSQDGEEGNGAADDTAGQGSAESTDHPAEPDAAQPTAAVAAPDGAEGPTLTDLLRQAHAGRLNGEVAQSLRPTHLHNLMVIPPGANEDASLALDGLPPLLEALSRASIDVTVIAAPALLEDPNATILAWATRSVLWTVEVGEVSREQAREAAGLLRLADITPFGVAMVGRPD